MKLYARSGFEWMQDGCVGLYCPSLTGATHERLYDSNLATENHATLVNMNRNTAWVGSELGTVAEFSGSPNFGIASNLPTRANADPITLAGWFFAQNASYSTTNYFFSLPLSSLGSNGMDFTNPQAVQFNLFGTGFNQSLITTIDLRSRWVYVVGVFDGTRGIVYGNGNVAAQVNHTAGTATSSRELNIARFGSFGGNTAIRMAAMTVHYRALTAAQIRQAAEAGPTGVWQLEPPRKRSYFAQVLTTTNRNRSSRYLCFPG